MAVVSALFDTQDIKASAQDILAVKLSTLLGFSLGHAHACRTGLSGVILMCQMPGALSMLLAPSAACWLSCACHPSHRRSTLSMSLLLPLLWKSKTVLKPNLASTVQAVKDGLERRQAENEATVLRTTSSSEPRSPLSDSFAAFALQNQPPQQEGQQPEAQQVAAVVGSPAGP